MIKFAVEFGGLFDGSNRIESNSFVVVSAAETAASASLLCLLRAAHLNLMRVRRPKAGSQARLAGRRTDRQTDSHQQRRRRPVRAMKFRAASGACCSSMAATAQPHAQTDRHAAATTTTTAASLLVATTPNFRTMSLTFFVSCTNLNAKKHLHSGKLVHKIAQI